MPKAKTVYRERVKREKKAPDDRYDCRMVLTGKLAHDFNEYIEKYWPGQNVKMDIIKRAVREFLDKKLVSE